MKRAEEILTALPFWPIGVNIEECAYQLYLKEKEAQENTQLEVSREKL